MSDIHVLHVLNSAHGGSAISTFELISSLQKNGIKSSLVCFNNASTSQKNRISQLVGGRLLFIPLYWRNKKIRAAWWKRPIIEAISLWRSWGGYRYQNEIAELIAVNKVTVVHTSTSLNTEGAIAAKRNGLPHIWHVRELIGPLKYFQFSNYNRVGQYMLDHSNVVVANSNVTAACLAPYVRLNKIKVIPNGIEVNKFSVRNHLQRNSKMVVAMVGNVTSRLKNHHFFIQVAGRFLGNDSVEFRVYGALPSGDDPYLVDLMELVKKSGLNDKFSFVDFKENPVDIMNEIDVLFHPTEHESFGRIFIEAMAAGIPVIGINKGGATEMIKNEINGFLIAMSIEEGERSVLRLVNDQHLRTRLGMNGRKLVEAEYSIERMTNRLIQMYKEIIS